MTFRNASNAARSFLAGCTEGHRGPVLELSLYAFEDWAIRVPVVKLTMGFNKSISPSAAIDTELENRKIVAAQFDALLTLLDDESMTVTAV